MIDFLFGLGPILAVQNFSEPGRLGFFALGTLWVLLFAPAVLTRPGFARRPAAHLPDR